MTMLSSSQSWQLSMTITVDDRTPKYLHSRSVHTSSMHVPHTVPAAYVSVLTPAKFWVK